ncbi:MAG: hypothetical protein KatS3mg087_0081 [Patescibacteria group bacterium]|nr:MAG: hypothetical protein KatS3mg087_0081 [Patescibacteria group bacterium]
MQPKEAIIQYNANIYNLLRNGYGYTWVHRPPVKGMQRSVGDHPLDAEFEETKKAILASYGLGASVQQLLEKRVYQVLVASLYRAQYEREQTVPRKLAHFASRCLGHSSTSGVFGR